MTMQKIKDILQGDILTFRASDNRFKVLICTSVFKDSSPHNFTFTALTYDSENKPQIENVLQSEFYGIGNTKNDFFKYSDSELENIWSIHPEIKPYFLGSYGLIVWRKDFMKFRENFEKIGNLNVIDNLDKNGNGGMNTSDMTVLNNLFTKNTNGFFENKGQKRFMVKAIMKNEN